MGRVALRSLQALLVTVGALLIVPYAVNIDTGGDAPSWLAPYAGWLRPAAIVCVVLTAVLESVDRFGSSSVAQSLRWNDDPRNVRRAAEQITRYVEQRQGGLLAERVRLALDERPGAVRQPVHMVQRISGSEFQLTDQLSVLSVFDQMDESMLILGAPGAGKTTQLLDLAGQLLDRLNTQPDAPIPVILDLPDWAQSRSPRRLRRFNRAEPGPRDLVGWLVDGLVRRYRIPPAVGRAWLSDNRLALLLDGLDEVPAGLRAHCVEQINKLQTQTGATRLVVCSREADYDRLTRRLCLQGAVVIRPLTRDQVRVFLRAVSPRLGDVAATLDQDEDLWDLLTTPLMLSVIVLAHQGGGMLPAIATYAGREDKRRSIFDAYVVEVLARVRAREVAPPEQALRALGLLARVAMGQETGVQVVRPTRRDVTRHLPREALDLERVWLLPIHFSVGMITYAAALTQLGGLGAAGVVLLLCCSAFLRFPARPAPVRSHLRVAVRPLLAFGVISAVWLILITLIAPPATAALLGSGMVLASTVALVSLIGTVLLVQAGDRNVLLVVPTFALSFVIVMVATVRGVDPSAVRSAVVGALTILGVMSLYACEVFTRTPDSVRWPGAVTVRTVEVLAGFAVAGGASVLFADPSGSPSPAPTVLVGWACGAALAYPIARRSAIALQVRAARLALVVAGLPDPWGRRFLGFGVDRSFLMRTGTEHRFVHLLVRDHLAGSEPAALAEAVGRRRIELSGPVKARHRR